MSATGSLVGIGVGPGDPDLITLKGLRALQAAPVLAYPAPETGGSLARAIVAPHLEGATKTEIPIRMPMVAARFPATGGLRPGRPRDRGAPRCGPRRGLPLRGRPLLLRVVQLPLRAHGRAVPSAGDPGGLVAHRLRGGGRRPLATRNDVLAVVPATLGEAELRARLESVEAAAIIKVGRHLAKVRAALDSLGLAAGAHYVERATMERERLLPLSDLDAAEAPYFSMVLVHRRGFAWN